MFVLSLNCIFFSLNSLSTSLCLISLLSLQSWQPHAVVRQLKFHGTDQVKVKEVGAPHGMEPWWTKATLGWVWTQKTRETRRSYLSMSCQGHSHHPREGQLSSWSTCDLFGDIIRIKKWKLEQVKKANEAINLKEINDGLVKKCPLGRKATRLLAWGWWEGWSRPTVISQYPCTVAFVGPSSIKT